VGAGLMRERSDGGEHEPGSDVAGVDVAERGTRSYSFGRALMVAAV
jgi:hypothetical protein